MDSVGVSVLTLRGANYRGWTPRDELREHADQIDRLQIAGVDVLPEEMDQPILSLLSRIYGQFVGDDTVIVVRDHMRVRDLSVE